MTLAKTSKKFSKFVLVMLLVGLAVLPGVKGGQTEAAVIKSVQRGTATFASGQNTLPVVLTAVDSSKTIVLGGINWGGGRIGISDPNASRVGLQLSGATTLNLQRLGSPAYATVVDWQAIEFQSGVSVQRRDTSFAAGTATVNVPISAVNLSESFVFISVAANTGSQVIDEEWTVRAQLTSTTNLELSRNETGIALNVYWQVVSFTGASVQRGLSTIGAGAGSATPAIASVNPATTFLLLTQRAAAAVNGSESQYQVRGRITSPTQLTFDRTSTTNSVEVAWEAVTLNDGSSVQSGGIAIAPTDTINTAALSSVTLSKSASFMSVRGGTGAETADLDATSFVHTISGSTTLTVSRRYQGTATAADVSWFVVQFVNQPPVLASIGSKSTNENQLLEFRVSASDPDLTTPVLSAVGLPAGAAFVDSLNGAGAFNWTPSFSQSGVYNVTFIASDGSLADSEIVTITVNNVNQSPVLNPIGAKSTNENQLLQFRVSSSDPDLTTPALSAVNVPSGAAFVDSLNGAGSFNWTPTFAQSGSYNVTFIALDGSLADSEVVAIMVNNVNQTPVLASIGPKSTNENQLLEFRISAADPDLTTPALSAVNAPSGAAFVDSLNGAGSFDWTPSFAQAGSYNVTFIASDGSLADSEIVTITVNNVNQPPVLDPIGAKSTNENQLLQFRVSSSDADLTTPALSAVNAPSGAAFVDSLNGAGSFNWTPTFAQSGSYNVTFIASDGSLADSEVVTITVNNVNAPPVLSPIGSKSVNENQLLQFSISASDVDGSTPTLTVVNFPSGVFFVDSLNGNGYFYWTPSFIQAGNYNVTFIASDGLLADSEVVAITVNEAGNQAPVLAAIGSKSTNENQFLGFSVFASDPDGGTPTLSAVNLPSGASFLDSLIGKGVFGWTPTFLQSGTYNVTFIASDGSLADSEVVTITVNNVNQPPVLASIGSKSTNETQLLEFRVSATDPDLTTPSLSLVNLPAGALFVDSLNGAGSFSWTPSLGQAGPYNVTFIASDGSLTDSEVVPITVDSVATGIDDIKPGALPRHYSLSQNYPNPFNGNTQIVFALPKGGHTTLEVFNILGQKVNTLVNEYLNAGMKVVNWDGRDERGTPVPSGIYLYQLRSGEFAQSKKMMYLK